MTRAAQPTAVVAQATTWNAFPALWPALLDEVRAAGVDRRALNVMLYRDDVPNVEVGVLASSPFVPSGRVVESCLPAGDVAMTVHCGTVRRPGCRTQSRARLVCGARAGAHGCALGDLRPPRRRPRAARHRGRLAPGLGGEIGGRDGRPPLLAVARERDRAGLDDAWHEQDGERENDGAKEHERHCPPRSHSGKPSSGDFAPRGEHQPTFSMIFTSSSSRYPCWRAKETSSLACATTAPR